MGEELYLWGGDSCRSNPINFNVVETFKMREEVWTTSVPTLGPLPSGGADGACTAANHSFLVQGGDLLTGLGANGNTESVIVSDHGLVPRVPMGGHSHKPCTSTRDWGQDS